MRTRTRLTTPPGQEPVLDEAGPDRSQERYSPGLAVPTEDRVASRWRPLALSVAALVVVAAVGYGLWQLGAASQQEDPALSEIPADG
jgi:hypothetical protein